MATGEEHILHILREAHEALFPAEIFGKAIFLSEQPDGHIEGFDLPLHLPQLFLLSTQPCVENLWVK